MPKVPTKKEHGSRKSAPEVRHACDTTESFSGIAFDDKYVGVVKRLSVLLPKCELSLA